MTDADMLVRLTSGPSPFRLGVVTGCGWCRRPTRAGQRFGVQDRHPLALVYTYVAEAYAVTTILGAMTYAQRRKSEFLGKRRLT